MRAVSYREDTARTAGSELVRLCLCKHFPVVIAALLWRLL